MQKRIHAVSAHLDADLVPAFGKLTQHGYVFKCVDPAHGKHLRLVLIIIIKKPVSVNMIVVL